MIRDLNWNNYKQSNFAFNKAYEFLFKAHNHPKKQGGLMVNIL